MHMVRPSLASLHVVWCYSGATEINMSYLHCSWRHDTEWPAALLTNIVCSAVRVPLHYW